MGNQPTHPKLFEVDEEIRILQDAVDDAKQRRERIIYKLIKNILILLKLIKVIRVIFGN